MKSRINFIEEFELPLRLDGGAQRSTMGTKYWLSMQPRNFGSDKILCSTPTS